MKEIVFMFVIDVVVIATMFAMYQIGRSDGRAEGREEIMARLSGNGSAVENM